MRSPRTLHALLILATILMLGVATVGFVTRPRRHAVEGGGTPSAPAAPQAPPAQSATALDSGGDSRGPAATPPPPSGGAHPQERARPAAVVVPPALALKFEKRYRSMPPDDVELAYQQLGAKLRVETRRGAPEDSLRELRCEVAWLTERRPRKE